MDRQTQLLKLQNYMKEVDKDITMILQNLQWDRNSLHKEEQPLLICKYDQSHKMPSKKLKEHEEMCYLKYNGYSSEDILLPELLDVNANTVVKFSSAMIQDVFQKAAEEDPLFKRGHTSEEVQPLSVERLQTRYSADERRALHDAVVGAAQTCPHEEFVLPSGVAGGAAADKSWLAHLAEQRDRRRRRTKYRAPPKTKNYSLVLRDVIAAQMELFNEVQNDSETDSLRERNREDIGHSRRETRNQRIEETHSNKQHKERNREDTDHTREEPIDQSHRHKYRKHINETKDTHRDKYQRDKHSENINYTREKTRDPKEYKSTTYDARYTHEDRHIKRDRESDRHSRRYDRSGEVEHSKERERSRREDYNGRGRKHVEYKRENRDRDTHSYSSDGKRESYEMSNEKKERDRSHSKRREDKYNKDFRH